MAMAWLASSQRCRLLRVVALCTTVLVPAAAEGFLAATSDQRELGRSLKISQDRLRSEAAHLAAVLRGKLGGCPHGKCGPSVVKAARDQLGDEAGWMQHEDPMAASLLRSYAKNAPPAVLLMPHSVMQKALNSDDDAASKGADQGQPSTPVPDEKQPSLFAEAESLPSAHTMSAASSEYEESYSEPDGKGNVVMHSTHCKNGKCVQRMQRSTLPKGVSRLASNKKSSLQPSTGSNRPPLLEPSGGLWSSFMPNMTSPLSAAVQTMAQDMERVKRSFGRDSFGFDSFMKDAFNEPTLPDLDGLDSNLDSVDSGNGHGENIKASAAQKDKEATQMQSLSSSNSTDTHISNGRFIKRTRHCRNGECETRIVERKLKPGEQEAEAQNKKSMV